MNSPDSQSSLRQGVGWMSWALLWVLVALWGSAFSLISIALRELPGITLVGLRLALGWLVLLGLFRLKGKRLPRKPRAWAYFAVIAVFGNCLPYYLITWGQEVVPSGMTGILMSITPLVVVGLAHFTLPGEKAGLSRVAGIVAGFLGIWFLLSSAGQEQVAEQADMLPRQLGILLGAVCYGVTIIIARRQPVQDPMLASLAVLGISALVMLGPALLAMPMGDWAALGWQTLLSVIVLGVFCTGYATVVYFQLIRTAGATFLSLMNYLIPLWAVAIGAIFLGEKLHPGGWLAMLVVLLGVGLAGARR
ncbi:MAG: DMT family transporter [Chromatiales bacterium]|nr:DMT family transporter [Chromatiales bacterium]